MNTTNLFNNNSDLPGMTLTSGNIDWAIVIVIGGNQVRFRSLAPSHVGCWSFIQPPVVIQHAYPCLIGPRNHFFFCSRPWIKQNSSVRSRKSKRRHHQHIAPPQPITVFSHSRFKVRHVKSGYWHMHDKLCTTKKARKVTALLISAVNISAWWA